MQAVPIASAADDPLKRKLNMAVKNIIQAAEVLLTPLNPKLS